MWGDMSLVEQLPENPPAQAFLSGLQPREAGSCLCLLSCACQTHWSVSVQLGDVSCSPAKPLSFCFSGNFTGNHHTSGKNELALPWLVWFRGLNASL